MDSNDRWDKKHLLKISNNKLEKSLDTYEPFNQRTAKKSPLVDVSSAVCFREEGKALRNKSEHAEPGRLRNVLLYNTVTYAVDANNRKHDQHLYRIPKYILQENTNPIWDSSKKENNTFIIRLSDSDEEKDKSPQEKRETVKKENIPTWDSSKSKNSPFIISLEDSDDSDHEEKNNSPEEKRETVREEKSQPTWDSSKTNNSPFVISLEDSDDSDEEEKDNSPEEKMETVREEKSQPTWDSSKSNNSPFVISLEDEDSDED